MNKSSGMTLVELVVVIGIVSVLAAVAIPNFERFQVRAMHTQAKLALADIYTAEMGYRGEYNDFTPRLDLLGFNPVGKMYFDVGFETDSAPLVGPPGLVGCNAICSFGCTSQMNISGTCLESAKWGLDGDFLPGTAGAKNGVFTAIAHAHFKGASLADAATWIIDEKKHLYPKIPSN